MQKGNPSFIFRMKYKRRDLTIVLDQLQIENKISDVQKFCHLPKLKSVEITFSDLSYSVKEGSIFRNKGEFAMLL